MVTAGPSKRATFFANVGDNFTRVLDLVISGLAGVPKGQEIVEGVLFFRTFGADVAMVPRGTPPPTVGGPIPANGSVGLGPTREPGSGWRLDEIWVKNSTAGSTAVVVFVGVVRDVE